MPPLSETHLGAYIKGCEAPASFGQERFWLLVGSRVPSAPVAFDRILQLRNACSPGPGLTASSSRIAWRARACRSHTWPGLWSSSPAATHRCGRGSSRTPKEARDAVRSAAGRLGELQCPVQASCKRFGLRPTWPRTWKRQGSFSV